MDSPKYQLRGTKTRVFQDVEPSSEDELTATSTAEAPPETSEDTDQEGSVRKPTERSSVMNADPQPLVVHAPVADNDPPEVVRQTASIPVLSVVSFYRRKPHTITSIPAKSTGIGITRNAGAGQKRKIILPAKYNE